MNLFIKDLKNLFSNKLLIFIWVILIVGLSFAFSGKYIKEPKNEKMLFGLVNEDTNNKYSNILVNFFRNNENFGNLVELVEGDKEEIEQKFYKGEIAGYVLVPEGFFDILIESSESKVIARINEKYSTSAIVLQNMMESYEDYVAAVQYNTSAVYYKSIDAGVSRDTARTKDFLFTYKLVMKAFDKESFFDYEIVKDYSAVSIQEYYLFAFVAIFIMYASLYIGIDIMKEKSYGVINRFRAAGGECSLFILSKLISGLIFVNLILVIPYLVRCIVRKSSINISIILFYFIVTLFCLAFSILFSMICKNIQTYILGSNMTCILIAILGGGIIPVSYLPENMSNIAEYIPIYGFINYAASILYGLSITEFAGFCIGISASAVIALIISWLVCRRSYVYE